MIDWSRGPNQVSSPGSRWMPKVEKANIEKAETEKLKRLNRQRPNVKQKSI